MTISSQEHLKNAVEAVIFASKSPLSKLKLKKIFHEFSNNEIDLSLIHI